jgi:hypothetical protein
MLNRLDLIHAVRGTAQKQLDGVRCFEPVEISAIGTASHDVDYANQHENEQPDHVDPNLRGPLCLALKLPPDLVLLCGVASLRCVAAKQF